MTRALVAVATAWILMAGGSYAKDRQHDHKERTKGCHNCLRGRAMAYYDPDTCHDLPGGAWECPKVRFSMETVSAGDIKKDTAPKADPCAISKEVTE